MAPLYGRARRLTAENGGFRPGQGLVRDPGDTALLLRQGGGGVLALQEGRNHAGLQGDTDTGFGSSLEPPGPPLEPAGPLLTHL